MQNNTNGGTAWEFWIVLTFLIGLLFFSYPPLKIVSGNTRFLRADWLLSLPLFVYFILNKRQVRLSKPIILAFLFVLVSAVSFFINPIRSEVDFLTVFLQLIFAVSLFIILANMNLKRETFTTLLRVWVIILTVVAIYAMYELVAINLNLPFSQLYPRTLNEFPVLGNYYRPVAMFSEPGFLSSLLSTGVAVLIPITMKSREVLFSKRVQRGCLIVITAGVVASVALSGYVTIVLALIVLAAVPVLRGTILRFWMVFGITVVIAVLITSFLAPEILDSMAARFDIILSVLSAGGGGRIIIPPGSIGARWVRLLSGLEALARNPIFGIGLGQFDQWAETVSFKYIPSDPRIGNLQGGYIQVIAQTGFVGTIVFAALWIQVFREAIYSVVTSEGVDQILVLSCTCVIVFMLVGWVHSFSAIHTVRWGFLGLCYGYISTGVSS